MVKQVFTGLQMLFPDYPRFIYKLNPLELVICQVRFPTILRIDTELPAQFQEMIRQEYPILNERNSSELPLPPEIQKLMGSINPFINNSRKAFDFVSEDEQWTLSLTSDFLALSTTSYRRWEEFRDHLKGPFEALVQVYAPSFFTRIGLRYRDVIKRSVLGLDDKTSWSDLLKPHIAGELASDAISAHVVSRATNTQIQLGKNDGYVMMHHGLAVDETSKEQVYIIDSDFYTEKRLHKDDVFDTLVEFNRNGRLLFKWCITDKLDNAMEPSAIAE